MLVPLLKYGFEIGVACGIATKLGSQSRGVWVMVNKWLSTSSSFVDMHLIHILSGPYPSLID